MKNFILVIDKTIDYFSFLFRQKFLFFLIFLAVSIGIYFNVYNHRTVHYGEVDIYAGGDYYFSKLNSIQEKIAPLSRLKIDFLTNANIGFGIKESQFTEQTESIVVLDKGGNKSSIVIEQKSDIFKNQLNQTHIFSKYLSLATKRENQLHFLDNFIEDSELLKSHALSEDSINSLDFNEFNITFFNDSPMKSEDPDSEFRRLKLGFKSYDKEYILPVLSEYHRYLNNIINQDIEVKINSFIDTNKQMIYFQQKLLTEQLKILKDNYAVLLNDELEKLKENVLIARSLGYEKSYFIKEFDVSPDTKSYQYVPYCSIGPTTLYCMGYQALQTKIDSLLQRNDPMPYIKGYREIQSALKQLEVASIASIAESLTSEYDFRGYKDYVKFDKYSLRYKNSSVSAKMNVSLIAFGIILFLLITIINKIYIDAKKINHK